MIEISGLSKTYGGKQALDDVSFRAEQGKVTALIGPNLKYRYIWRYIANKVNDE